MTTERKVETIDVVKQMVADGQISQDIAEKYFPELKESEGESIRKRLIELLKDNDEQHFAKEIAWLEKQGDIDSHVKLPTFTFDDILALQCCMKIATANEYKELYVQLKSLHDRVYDAYWLEKQGEKKSVPNWMPKFLDELRSKKNYFDFDEHKDFEGGILAIIKWMNPNYFNEKDSEQKPAEVEPKFHEGDWIIFNGLILRIDEIVDGYYRTTTIGGIHNSYVWGIDNAARLWTIEDAKDGDVLVYNNGCVEIILLFKEWCREVGKGAYNYAHMTSSGHNIHINDWSDCSSSARPATKEQRDILIKAMADAGYTFDFGKKKLKKNLKE